MTTPAKECQSIEESASTQSVAEQRPAAQGPWRWLLRAGTLKGKALHTAMFIWLAAQKHNSTTVVLNVSGLARKFGFQRSSACRGLDELERAGLVSVDRSRGRNPVVTLAAAKDCALANDAVTSVGGHR